MTFDEEVDPYDPIVADRFRLLDRVDPGEFDRPGRQPDHRPGTEETGPSRVRYLLAGAAVAAVVGLSALALARTGADRELETSAGGDVQVETGSTAEPSVAGDDRQGNGSLRVEVPDDRGDAGGEDRSTTDRSTADLPADTETEVATDDRTSGSAVTTESTEASARTTTAAPAKTTTTGEGPTTTTKAPPQTTTVDLSDKSSLLKPPTGEKTVIVRGQVSEVFTDCRSRLILNAAGEVESVGPVSCDGGSHIVVEGTRIHTSSGFVAADDAYDKHIPTLRPGQTVTVTAIPTGATGGRLTLDCVLCGITLGR